MWLSFVLLQDMNARHLLTVNVTLEPIKVSIIYCSLRSELYVCESVYLFLKLFKSQVFGLREEYSQM